MTTDDYDDRPTTKTEQVLFFRNYLESRPRVSYSIAPRISPAQAFLQLARGVVVCGAGSFTSSDDIHGDVSFVYENR